MMDWWFQWTLHSRILSRPCLPGMDRVEAVSCMPINKDYVASQRLLELQLCAHCSSITSNSGSDGSWWDWGWSSLGSAYLLTFQTLPSQLTGNKGLSATHGVKELLVCKALAKWCEYAHRLVDSSNLSLLPIFGTIKWAFSIWKPGFYHMPMLSDFQHWP
jgi:hypothetical protein